ncbi:MAG TPA: cyclase family protein, partial [Pseudonocardiaceae bacterium]|nr:cyclase family protein [Pseudonocardiaceae bacterium]
MTSRYVDLSHPIKHEMTTYPGLPGPTISTHTSRQESAQRLATGVSLHIGRIEMVANTGTYVDAPYHFHADGADVAELPLERLVDVPVVVVRASGRAALGPEVLDDVSALWGKAVLVHTGWSRHWGTPAYLAGSPYLTKGFAEAVVEANVALLGVDALNVDNVDDPTRPVHHTVIGQAVQVGQMLDQRDAVTEHGVVHR